MKLKINGKLVIVDSLSELTFNRFNSLIIKSKVNSLQEYLSFFCNISIVELLNSKFEGASLPALHQMVFNVDIEKMIKEKKEAIEFERQFYLTNDLVFDTFGLLYIFDLYRQKKDLNSYELSLYALAIGLTKSTDTDIIEKTFETFSKQKWVNVLPQGFFLLKKLSGSKMNLIRLWLHYTIQLKKIKLAFLTSKRKLINMEKS